MARNAFDVLSPDILCEKGLMGLPRRLRGHDGPIYEGAEYVWADTG